jgi:hypothetical protein
MFLRSAAAIVHPVTHVIWSGRLSGSLAAFKVAISGGLRKNSIRFFSESFRTPFDSFISKK